MLYFIHFIFIYLCFKKYSFFFNLQQYEKIPFQDPLKKVTAKAFMSLLACSSSAQSYACKGKNHFIVLQHNHTMRI